MNSPVHLTKQKMSYQSDSVQQSVTHIWHNLTITIFMQCRHGAGCHMRLGDGCHSVKVGLTTGLHFFSFGVCIFSVDFAMHVPLLKQLI